MKRFLAFTFLMLLAGCNSLPSMKYCERVSYVREGNKATIHAECSLPVGDTVPGI